jgi:hypothetical protein
MSEKSKEIERILTFPVRYDPITDCLIDANDMSFAVVDFDGLVAHVMAVGELIAICLNAWQKIDSQPLVKSDNSKVIAARGEN